MTVKRTHVYKINVYNSGTTYEETSKRAYAWELVSLLRRLGREQSNFSDALVIIEHYDQFQNLLDEYEEVRNTEEVEADVIL